MIELKIAFSAIDATFCWLRVVYSCLMRTYGLPRAGNATKRLKKG
jgi:hypothetical protein